MKASIIHNVPCLTCHKPRRKGQEELEWLSFHMSQPTDLLPSLFDAFLLNTKVCGWLVLKTRRDDIAVQNWNQLLNLFLHLCASTFICFWFSAILSCSWPHLRGEVHTFSLTFYFIEPTFSLHFSLVQVTEESRQAQFLIPVSALGQNRAKASLERAQALNPMVEVRADTDNVESKPDDFFLKFDAVSTSFKNMVSVTIVLGRDGNFWQTHTIQSKIILIIFKYYFPGCK